MAEYILVAENLRRSFGDFVAVKNVSLQLLAGEIVGLLGPNGAGKSTTMRMLVGLLEPHRGSVTVEGQLISENPIEAKRHLGFLSDEPMILPYLSGWEYIQFVAGLYDISPQQVRLRAEPLLKRFGLSQAIHRRADGYSHGMKQKLALVAQLVHEPRVLLADEPTIGLDPASTAEMHEVFREYSRAGNTILLSTHLLPMAETVCDKVLIMSDGYILYEGAPTQPSGESLEKLFLRLTSSEVSR